MSRREGYGGAVALVVLLRGLALGEDAERLQTLPGTRPRQRTIRWRWRL